MDGTDHTTFTFPTIQQHVRGGDAPEPQGYSSTDKLDSSRIPDKIPDMFGDDASDTSLEDWYHTAVYLDRASVTEPPSQADASTADDILTRWLNQCKADSSLKPPTEWHELMAVLSNPDLAPEDHCSLWYVGGMVVVWWWYGGVSTILDGEMCY